jgi:hypothetical protein
LNVNVKTCCMFPYLLMSYFFTHFLTAASVTPYFSAIIQ